MFCVTCGKQIGDQSKFCPYCGAEIKGVQTHDDETNHGVSAFAPAESATFARTPDASDSSPQTFAAMEQEASATRLAERRRKDNSAIALTAVIAAACVLFFLLYIGPKFLGVQFLPIDPFGVMDEGGSGEDSEATRRADDGVSAEGGRGDSGDVPEIRSVQISKTSPDPLQGTGFSTNVGDVFELEAVITPGSAEQWVVTEWEINDERLAHFSEEDDLRATIAADAPGIVSVTLTAYTDVDGRSDAKSNTVEIEIIEPSPADDIPPYKGNAFVTNEPKLGIFVRSDHLVNGEGNILNDGNKIAWIEGGDTSVELVATGVEYHEGNAGFWWYQVTVPESYRNTAKQKENYDGKTLVGWVRSDVVKQIR